MRVSGVIFSGVISGVISRVTFGRGQYDVTAVQQIVPVHEISSPYSFCYLIIRHVHWLARRKYEGFRSNFKSNFRSRAIWRYRSAINRTSARNTQSIFVLLSHRHQKCTLIGEITGLYFSWNVDKNSKNTSQFQLVAGSLIHLSAYFSLWRIDGVQWMTFLWHFWYYLTVSNGSK